MFESRQYRLRAPHRPPCGILVAVVGLVLGALAATTGARRLSTIGQTIERISGKRLPVGGPHRSVDPEAASAPRSGWRRLGRGLATACMMQAAIAATAWGLHAMKSGEARALAVYDFSLPLPERMRSTGGEGASATLSVEPPAPVGCHRPPPETVVWWPLVNGIERLGRALLSPSGVGRGGGSSSDALKSQTDPATAPKQRLSTTGEAQPTAEWLSTAWSTFNWVTFQAGKGVEAGLQHAGIDPNGVAPYLTAALFYGLDAWTALLRGEKLEVLIGASKNEIIESLSRLAPSTVINRGHGNWYHFSSRASGGEGTAYLWSYDIVAARLIAMSQRPAERWDAAFFGPPKALEVVLGHCGGGVYGLPTTCRAHLDPLDQLFSNHPQLGLRIASDYPELLAALQPHSRIYRLVTKHATGMVTPPAAASQE